jgi:hypothetical protein
MPLEPTGSPLRALSKPAFSASLPGMFICGTEEQAEDRKGLNRIVVGRLDLAREEVDVRDNGDAAVWTHPVYDQVRLHAAACTHWHTMCSAPESMACTAPWPCACVAATLGSRRSVDGQRNRSPGYRLLHRHRAPARARRRHHRL